MLSKWDELPEEMQNNEVEKYYELLKDKQLSLLLKRLFDVIVSLILILLLWPVMLVIALWIKADSSGPVIFKQVRITQYGREFDIYKFRTMRQSAAKDKVQLTQGEDQRITKVGRLIRKVRLDELPQLVNVLKGEMSFVGTRPEVPRYVQAYTDEMLATLLLPAGITSKASIEFKDEDALLEGASDVEETYIKEVLPQKMAYNLAGLSHFSLVSDFRILLQTVIAVLR